MTLIIELDRTALTAARAAFREGNLEIKLVAGRREWRAPLIRILPSDEEKKLKPATRRTTPAQKTPVQTELQTGGNTGP
jgi:hypothetical protein